MEERERDKKLPLVDEKQRASLLFKAFLDEQCERYEEMVQAMTALVKLVGNETVAAAGPPHALTLEERNLFSVAYKNVVGCRRAAWRITSSIQQKEELNPSKVTNGRLRIIHESKLKLEDEIVSICKEVIRLIDEYMLPFTKDIDWKIFLSKMKGDYYRFIAEVQSDPSEKKRIGELAQQQYHIAREFIQNSYSAFHPYRLSNALNQAVFLYEVGGDRENAIRIAREAFDAAIDDLDNCPEELYAEATSIMQLLRNNLTLWQLT